MFQQLSRRRRYLRPCPSDTRIFTESLRLLHHCHCRLLHRTEATKQTAKIIITQHGHKHTQRHRLADRPIHTRTYARSSSSGFDIIQRGHFVFYFIAAALKVWVVFIWGSHYRTIAFAVDRLANNSKRWDFCSLLVCIVHIIYYWRMLIRTCDNNGDAYNSVNGDRVAVLRRHRLHEVVILVKLQQE